MRILVVSATYIETARLKEAFSCDKTSDPFFFSGKNKFHQVDILITGVGIASTAFQLGKVLPESGYDFVFNIGIAGSFNKKLLLGEVVNVTTDILSEMGSENGDAFLKFSELQMSRETLSRSAYSVENNSGTGIHAVTKLPRVKGITVNTVHGENYSIKKACELFSPDVETMEGAAFLYACMQEKIKCEQIRSISNYVEERNLENWQIKPAIKNLNDFLISLIHSL